MRFAEPPVSEDREFLAPIGFATVNGQAARGLTVALTFAEQPKIARPQEGAEFIPPIGFMELVQQLETGVARLGGNLLTDVQAAVVEEILDEADGLDVRERKLVYLHRLLVKVSRMEKFDAIRQAVGHP